MMHQIKRGRLIVHCVGLYYSNCILFFSFTCNPYSLVLILRIPPYLGIKGDQFFSDFRIFLEQELKNIIIQGSVAELTTPQLFGLFLYLTVFFSM
jgi:hypothetical protein